MNKLESEEKEFNDISQLLFDKMGLTTLIQHGQKGAFGLVLFVQDNNTKHKYAVKAQSIIDKSKGKIDNDKLEMCKAESKILESIKHKNIVEYHSDYTIDFYHFIQMDLCECSLEQWIEKRGNQSLPYGLFLQFLNQIIDGIDHLHKLNYVLRDLSIKNILISSDGTIKLCDFGLAKKIDTQIMKSEIQSKKFRGALLYYPPELMKEIESNSQTYTQSKKGDIWALGVCLSLLGGISFLAVLQFIQPHEQIKYSPLLDNFCNSIIQFILIKNPAERPSIPKIRKFIFDKLSQNNEELQINQIINSDKNQKDVEDIYNQNNQELQVNQIINQDKNKEEAQDIYNQRDLEIDITKYKQTEQECLNDLKNIESIFKLGYINLYCYQNIKKAKSYFRKALLLNQNDPDVYLGLASVYIEIKRIEGKNYVQEIEDLIEKASQISSNYWRVYFLKFLKYNDEYDKVYEESMNLQYAIDRKQNLPLLIGYHLSNEKNIIMEQLRDKFPIKYRSYYFHLGYIYFALNEYEKAEQCYKQQLSFFPNDIMTLNNAAKNYFLLNQKDNAIKLYNQALQINPKFIIAKTNLEKISSQKK